MDVRLALRNTLVWFVGTVAVPLSLVWYLVGLKHATFLDTVARGELLTLAVAIAGATVALEMILKSSSLFTGLYQMALLLLLMGNVLYFCANVKDTAVGGTVTLEAGQAQISAWLLGAAVVFGLYGVLRQGLQDLNET